MKGFVFFVTFFFCRRGEEGFGWGVKAYGCRLLGCVFRTSCLCFGSRVSGSVSQVPCLGFRVSGSGSVSGSWSRISGFGVEGLPVPVCTAPLSNELIEYWMHEQPEGCVAHVAAPPCTEREFFIDNLLVRVHHID